MLGRQIGRKALVVFSDGEDQGSHVALEDVERRLQASDVTLYMIAQGRGITQDYLKTDDAAADPPTGGRTFTTDSIDAAARRVRRAARRAVASIPARLPADQQQPGRYLARDPGRGRRTLRTCVPGRATGRPLTNDAAHTNRRACVSRSSPPPTSPAGAQQQVQRSRTRRVPVFGRCDDRWTSACWTIAAGRSPTCRPRTSRCGSMATDRQVVSAEWVPLDMPTKRPQAPPPPPAGYSQQRERHRRPADR